MILPTRAFWGVGKVTRHKVPLNLALFTMTCEGATPSKGAKTCEGAAPSKGAEQRSRRDKIARAKAGREADDYNIYDVDSSGSAMALAQQQQEQQQQIWNDNSNSDAAAHQE